jgi:hypothetical protein
MYIGDTDFDGQVTSQDYTAVGANLGVTGIDLAIAWFYGDTNFDGNVDPVDPSDNIAIDAALSLGVGNTWSAAGASAIPESALIFDSDLACFPYAGVDRANFQATRLTFRPGFLSKRSDANITS